MSNTAKTDISGNKYETELDHYTTPIFPTFDPMTNFDNTTEPLLSRDEDLEYGELLTGLANKYGWEDLSQYENPEEVRISYQVSGTEFEWNHSFIVEVDTVRPDFGSIINSILSARELLGKEDVQDWGNVRKRYLTTEVTEAHSYQDTDISRTEMKEFIDSLLEENR